MSGNKSNELNRRLGAEQRGRRQAGINPNFNLIDHDFETKASYPRPVVTQKDGITTEVGGEDFSRTAPDASVEQEESTDKPSGDQT